MHILRTVFIKSPVRSLDGKPVGPRCCDLSKSELKNRTKFRSEERCKKGRSPHLHVFGGFVTDGCMAVQVTAGAVYMVSAG